MSDFECFTILRQTDVTGLQVQNRKGNCKLKMSGTAADRAGIDASYIPDTFVINIGDQFARWTSMSTLIPTEELTIRRYLHLNYPSSPAYPIRPIFNSILLWVRS